MCSVRLELLDLFLQVVCRKGQWQAEGFFSPQPIAWGCVDLQLIPEQFTGGKKPLLQLAIDPAYTPLEETSQVTPVLQYTKCNTAAHRLPAHHNNRYVPLQYV